VGAQFVEDKSLPASLPWGLLAFGVLMIVWNLVRKKDAADSISVTIGAALILWLRLPAMRSMAVFGGVVLAGYILTTFLKRRPSWDDRPDGFVFLFFAPFLVLIFALIPVDLKVFTLRADELSYRVRSFGLSRAHFGDSVDRTGMTARVVHYRDSDSRVWFFESQRGAGFHGITVEGGSRFRDPAGVTITGDELGRRIVAWAGVKLTREEFQPIPGFTPPW
jgi:hypothetical protein